MIIKSRQSEGMEVPGLRGPFFQALFGLEKIPQLRRVQLARLKIVKDFGGGDRFGLKTDATGRQEDDEAEIKDLPEAFDLRIKDESLMSFEYFRHLVRQASFLELSFPLYLKERFRRQCKFNRFFRRYSMHLSSLFLDDIGLGSALGTIDLVRAGRADL
jgi:hypothetical protein